TSPTDTFSCRPPALTIAYTTLLLISVVSGRASRRRVGAGLETHGTGAPLGRRTDALDYAPGPARANLCRPRIGAGACVIWHREAVPAGSPSRKPGSDQVCEPRRPVRTGCRNHDHGNRHRNRHPGHHPRPDSPSGRLTTPDRVRTRRAWLPPGWPTVGGTVAAARRESRSRRAT